MLRCIKIVFIFSLLFYACDSDDSTPAPNKKNGPLFQIKKQEETNISFVNQVTEGEEKNYFNFEYVYNGAGVGIADINNDQLPDLFFVGNEVSNQLYLNKGNLQFENISEQAKIQGDGAWNNGISFVDINNDGFLDIYVCKGGWPSLPKEKRINKLYINNGDLSFDEQAQKYGLDESGFSLQSSFFDFDNDGDLDVYITNHPTATNMDLDERLAIRNNPPNKFRDKLYENKGGNKFVEISEKAGITNYGHGLGLVTTDINKDGWIDIYVANDYKEPDYLYINNGDGTFTNQIDSYFGHISFNSMGVDIADINGDTEEDIFVSEMLPFDYKKSKTNMASMNPKLFDGMVKLGLHHQYMHNAFQLNSGPIDNSNKRRFNDISQMTGTSKTDWSWSCLLSDFDNDGQRDLFVANGNKRDVFDKDYRNKANAIAKKQGGQLSLDDLYAVIPSSKTGNQIFENAGNLQFTNQTESWGLSEEMLSQGAAAGDLDNDGDLDIVVNNLDEPSLILENRAETLGNNFIKIKLLGDHANKVGINAKVLIETANGNQFFELKTTRGYMSSSESLLHFGLGKTNAIKAITVNWLDGTETVIQNPEINTKIDFLKSKDLKASSSVKDYSPFFSNRAELLNTPFQHKEKTYDDYKTQILLPHKLSQNGPFISKGDVNGDGLEDFFVGAASGHSGQIYIQESSGKFSVKGQNAIANDMKHEDLGSLFFDADGDQDLDLFVVSGGFEFPVKSPLYQDRLYLNDGSGNFSKSSTALPPMISSCQSVSASDFDKDGDIDLFVGGRVFPDHYPYATPSYLLQNDGTGKFTDLALSQGQGLNLIGMVTSSIWSDIDNDQDEDLIIVGEWMPISIFKNNDGILTKATEEYGLGNTSGWWNKIIASDYDNDGDEDFIIGNLGLNHKFQASESDPFHIYCGDYDGNGSYDILLAKNNDGSLVPIRGRQCSSEQIPSISDKFETYEAFAESDLYGLIGEQLNEKLHYEAKMFESIVLENNDGRLEIKKLPREVQTSPINGIIVDDFNKDGIKDLILAGNMYQTEAETSRADASHGHMLLGTKDKSFKVLSTAESGWYTPGDVKDILKIRSSKGPRYLVTNNNEALSIFSTMK